MFGHVTSIIVDDCVAQRTMVKSCSAVGCAECWVSGSSIKWYRFPPVGTERRNACIAAVRRERWHLLEHSWLCSRHFASGAKSHDPCSPDYIPSVFSFCSSPVKRRQAANMKSYNRRIALKQARVKNAIANAERKATRRRARLAAIEERRAKAISGAELTARKTSRAANHVIVAAEQAAEALVQLGGTTEIGRKHDPLIAVQTIGVQTQAAGDTAAVQTDLTAIELDDWEDRLNEASPRRTFGLEAIKNDETMVKCYRLALLQAFASSI